MPMMINDSCVNCAACEPECPNGAISVGDPVYVIDADRCTECVGHYDESQCVDVCPVECIVLDPARPETREELERKFAQLQAVA